MSRLGHLARRFAGSLSRRPPMPVDEAWAESHLLEPEARLWRQLGAADRRHAVAVARRFEALGQETDTEWSREEMAGALLHDIGKLSSALGTTARVVATIVGPHTARLRRYHDHEAIGADMLTAAGSAPTTIDLVRGRGRAATALRQADDI